MKNFDNKEFDDVIKNILLKIFDNCYMNRNDKVHNTDNLYKKYDENRYNFIKKKYGIIRNDKLIFRFNRYLKESYIIKLLKNDKKVFLEKDQTYESLAINILKEL